MNEGRPQTAIEKLEPIIRRATEAEDFPEAIKAIGETIRRMSDISSEIFDSVGSQGQATVEIARNVAEASTGTADVSRNISGVTAAASDASEAASEVLAAASQLSDQSAALSRQIESFLGHVRAA